MPDVPIPSTTPASLNTGLGRPALQPVAPEHPLFADMLGQCIITQGTGDGVAAATAGMGAEPHYALPPPMPPPPTLPAETGQATATYAVDGDDPSAAKPITDQPVEDLSTPTDLVPNMMDQSPPPPLVLPAQILAATAVASPPALQEEPDPEEVALEGGISLPGHGRLSTPPKPSATQAETAGPAQADEAASNAAQIAAPSVAMDFQQSLTPQPIAHQTPAAPAIPASQGPRAPGTALPMPSPATTPMQQIMPVVASVVALKDGASQTLVIRLDPAELGRVQVHIERTIEGPSRIIMQVERPETLQLLVRDQPQLHRALDLAGVPADGRLLQFQLVPDQPSLPQGSTQFGAGGSAGGFASSNGGGGAGQQSPHRHGGYAPGSSPDVLPVRRRRLAGVDITA